VGLHTSGKASLCLARQLDKVQHCDKLAQGRKAELLANLPVEACPQSV